MAEGPVILIIDSDTESCVALGGALAQAGYVTIMAADGLEGGAQFAKGRPALVILDVEAPGGWEAFRALRARSDVPVLIVTRLAAEADQIIGLEAGADSYVTKPFSPKIVVARMEAILRRLGRLKNRFDAGPLNIDSAMRQATLDGHLVALTEREFVLLAALAANPERVFSRADLLIRCWGRNYPGTDRVVDVHLASLRRKLGKRRALIRTVRGVGYKYCPM